MFGITSPVDTVTWLDSTNFTGKMVSSCCKHGGQECGQWFLQLNALSLAVFFNGLPALYPKFHCTRSLEYFRGLSSKDGLNFEAIFWRNFDPIYARGKEWREDKSFWSLFQWKMSLPLFCRRACEYERDVQNNVCPQMGGGACPSSWKVPCNIENFCDSRKCHKKYQDIISNRHKNPCVGASSLVLREHHK